MIDSHLLTVEYRGRVRLVRVWSAVPVWFAREEGAVSGPTGSGNSEGGALADLLELLDGEPCGRMVVRGC